MVRHGPGQALPVGGTGAGHPVCVFGERGRVLPPAAVLLEVAAARGAAGLVGESELVDRDLASAVAPANRLEHDLVISLVILMVQKWLVGHRIESP